MLNVEAALLEGIRHQQAGDREAAEAVFREVLRLAGEHPRALYLCGLLCLRQERVAEATALLRRAAAADPAHEGAALNLCRALIAARRFGPALEVADRALVHQPACAELHYLRGTALSFLGRPKAALPALRHATILDRAHAPTRLNLGNACADLDRLADAERHIRRALRLDPSLLEAWASLGFVLTARGRLAEARAACAEAIARRADFAHAHWVLATAALLQGDFATGFREYEWRKRHDRYRRDFVDLPGPAWTGGPLAGRDLLIHAEQGLGDAIQFSRYVPELAARGARVTLACDRRLLRLLATTPGLHRALDKAAPLPRYNLWVDQMSLPGLFGTVPGTIPHPEGWLRAEPRDGIALPPGRRAGIVWAGNPLHSNDRRRSLPQRFLPALVAAVRGAGYAPISLQTGPHAAEAAHHGLPTPPLGDFADTAAVLAALDLVVCVDTAVAHLAGALGVPALVMLPFAPDWRWMPGRDDTPWYASLRLIRQPRPGDWPAVIAAIGIRVAQFSPLAQPVL